MTGPEAARRLLASAVLRRLASGWTGGQLFLTGGSLRDRLLRLPTRDVDLAVLGDARAAAEALARQLGGRCFPLGRAPLVTWRVAAERFTLDLWSVEGDIEKDIRRRDFTVNALFWRLPRGPLLDLVGGLDDLEAGRIRVVRPENLAEDPLRVIRGARLLATHPHLRLTADCERHLAEAAGGLRSVARERVTEELRTLLAGPGAERALIAAFRIGALGALLPAWNGYPDAAAVARIAGRLARLGTSAGALGAGAREVAPALLGAPAAGLPDAWDEAAAASALAGMGWPPRHAQRAARAAALGERILPALGGRTADLRALAVEAGEALAPALAWAVARSSAPEEETHSAGGTLFRWARRFATRPPLLAGEEVARLLQLPPGPARGAAVAALRTAQARGEVRTGAQAREFLRRTLRLTDNRR